MLSIKTSILQVFIGVIGLQILLPSLSYAPLVTSPKLLREPLYVSDQIEGRKRQELNLERAALDKRRLDLEKSISQHDIRCTHVPVSNTALNQECLGAQNKFLSQIEAYDNDLNVFNKDVTALIAKFSPPPQNLLEPLFSKGSKDSAPVNLRFKPLNEPLVVDPQDVSGASKMTAGESQSDLRDALAPQKDGATIDAQVHALTAEGLDSFHRGDLAGAIGHYRSALQLSPDDRGIQLALGHVLYLTQKGQKGSPKAEILLDALQYGKGDWEASIAYLENAFEKNKNKDNALAARDALNYAEGLYAYQQLQESQQETRLDKELDEMFTEMILAPVTMQTLREGFKNMEAGDYLGAVYSFENALEMNPNDGRIREILNYADGLLEADMARLSFDDFPQRSKGK